LKTRDLGQNPRIGANGQIILKVPKSNTTYGTGQCDVIIFFNAIHNNTMKQYLEIAANWPHCLSGPIMTQITIKHFNFQITVV